MIQKTAFVKLVNSNRVIGHMFFVSLLEQGNVKVLTKVNSHTGKLPFLPLTLILNAERSTLLSPLLSSIINFIFRYYHVRILSS